MLSWNRAQLADLPPFAQMRGGRLDFQVLHTQQRGDGGKFALVVGKDEMRNWVNYRRVDDSENLLYETTFDDEQTLVVFSRVVVVISGVCILSVPPFILTLSLVN